MYNKNKEWIYKKHWDSANVLNMFLLSTLYYIWLIIIDGKA